MIPIDERPLEPEERRLRLLLTILSVAFALAVFAYLLPALFGPLRSAWTQLPFVTNSVVKIGTFAMLAFVAAADPRRFRALILLLIWGHVISLLAMGAALAYGDLSPPEWRDRVRISMTWTLVGAMLLDGGIVALLIVFFARADRAHYQLRYLSPVEFRALRAVADVVLQGDPELVPSEQIARNVDTYLSSFQAQRKWIAKLALLGLELYPLLSWRAPLSYQSHAERAAFVRRALYQDVDRRLLPKWLRTAVQGITRMGSQLTYLGYYNDPRTHAAVGYQRFSERADTPQRLQASPPLPRRPLRTLGPADVSEQELSADIVIVGTGAGGSVLAHELVAQGLDVLMLERGRHVDPSQFTEDEVDMLGRLYSDGALQLSRDFRFQVLQGSCVGGTTVVNNAVSFRLPDRVLERWNDRGQTDARLDERGYRASEEAVWNLVHVQEQRDHLNPSGHPIAQAMARLGLTRPPNRAGAVSANIHGCLGCGYCNIGCAYGKKLSMLDEVLPRAQAAGRGRLRILAQCEVDRFEGLGRRITAARCRLDDGRTVRVKGRTFAVAAGAISSSLLLLRSAILPDRAGLGLCFNIGSPISGVFRDSIRAYAGLQISHYVDVEPSRGYILETWYNPPVAQALTMPGWFDEHFEHMKAYDRTASLGVLVGSESNGRASTGGLTQRTIDYSPTRGDLDKLLQGLVLAGDVLFEAGCDPVMPHTFRLHRYRSRAELRQLPSAVRDAADLTIGTGHPQGGNAVSARPDRGVLNPDFRVKGYENLFVTDASAFPSSTGVNPQITVMALAHYASRFVIDAVR